MSIHLPIPLEVLTQPSGSHVVVMFPPNPWNANDRAYIDARKDARYPGFSFIEVVRSGHLVIPVECVPDFRAPERIIQILRDIVNGRPL